MILTTETPISQIVVGERHRKDLGDIDALASSIAELGLLQPVVVDKRGHLIAGFRRIEACKSLGLANVPALLVEGLDDALKALHAERDENTCRKEFTPSELVEMGRAIEAVEAPKASSRVAANLPHSPVVPNGTAGRTAPKVAEALGVSARTYQRAKSVVEAAEDETDPAHDTAKGLVKHMDSGAVSVTSADDAVQSARRQAARDRVIGGSDKSKAAVQARRDTIRRLAGSGHSIDQMAKQLGLDRSTVQKICKDEGIDTVDKNMPKQKKIDANRVVETSVTDLQVHVESTLSTMEGRWPDLDPLQVERWVASLEDARKSLNLFIRRLKETTL